LGHLGRKQGQVEAQGGEALAHLVVELPSHDMPFLLFRFRQPGCQSPELLLGLFEFRDVSDDPDQSPHCAIAF